MKNLPEDGSGKLAAPRRRAAGHVFVSTGEASGDSHGALLVSELRRRSRGIEVRGFGGDRMAAAGAKVDRSLRGGAVMGLTGVVRRAGTFISALGRMKARWRANPPAAVILIDFPGFNLRLGGIARDLGIPVYYYICPQVWAWGAGRLLDMRKMLKRAFLVLPFEEALYQAFGIPASFVGHPLMESVPVREGPGRAGARRAGFRRAGLDPSRPLVVMLPGSRSEEISRHIPVFLPAVHSVSARKPRLQWAVVAAPGMEREVRAVMSSCRGGGAARDRIRVVTDSGYSIRAGAAMAWAASGTATLELGLLGIPQLVVYRWNWLNWMLASRLVKVPFVSLVNLILDRRAVPEYLQRAARPEALATETLRRIGKPDCARRDARELRERLRTGCGPTAAVAAAVLSEIGGAVPT